MENIGLRIKEIAERKRIKIKDLAEKIGMTEQNLYQILKKKSIQIGKLEEIANALDVPLNIFFRKDLFNSDMENNEENLKKELENQRLVNELLLKNNKLLEDKLKQLESKLQQNE